MTTREFDDDGNCVREITAQEPEWSPLDLALVIEAQRVSRIPRGSHGVPLADATNPKHNPYAVDRTGRFVAEPIVDFAQAAIDQAREARKKAVGNDDWPLIWTARLETFGASGDPVDDAGEGDDSPGE